MKYHFADGRKLRVNNLSATDLAIADSKPLTPPGKPTGLGL